MSVFEYIWPLSYDLMLTFFISGLVTSYDFDFHFCFWSREELRFDSGIYIYTSSMYTNTFGLF